MHSYIASILTGLIVLAVIVATFFVSLAGFRYITSSGNPSKLALAKRQLVRALLGLCLVIGSSTLGVILTHSYGAPPIAGKGGLPAINALPANTNTGLGGVIVNAISGLLSVLISSAAKPFISSLEYFIKGTPLLTANPSVVHLWLLSVGIADALLVLVLVLIGFHVMSGVQLGMGEVDLKTLLPQTVLVFGLINSSIFLLDGFISLSNAMIRAIGLITSASSPWQALIRDTADISGYSLIGLIIFIIFLIFSVILLVYYVGRLVTLYVGAVLAPIVVLIWLIPGFREFAEQAFKAYLTTIFVLFVHVIILSLAGSLFAALGSGGIGHSLMALVLGLATLTMLIKSQGVMSHLRFATIGPRTARKLGVSFVSGLSYVSQTARTSWNQTSLPVDKGSIR